MVSLSISNSLSGGDWELHKVPVVGDPTHPALRWAGNSRASTGERQRRAAVQGGMAPRRIAVILQLGQFPLQITAIPQQHVVEEFSKRRPNQALDDWT
jgi:hypothetical protein